MPTTEYFFVPIKGKKVKKCTTATRDYFGDNTNKHKVRGTAKYIIEIFGYDHEVVAQKVKKMVDESEMADKLFLIKVDTR